ncbi:acyltransferase family protein [Pseudogulbenkiania ferrooxidans]|uniref:acyltransferase family protein n=1 Tax=Pseudogulbenkiania ferrooxidans TaxID=549169 RepID=UPI0009DB79B8|nr:acyltransferase family protein [Pseudogulbenkiania ferrooxidans]
MNIASQTSSYINDQTAQEVKSKERDLFIDFTKGIAILLVVLGHTLQYQVQPANFDELFSFRFIYSFHMPFFVFLSGAAASHWIKKFDMSASLPELIQITSHRIYQSGIRLLLPFFGWAIIRFWTDSPQESFFHYIAKVIQHVDYGLWFLPCIFWCATYTSLFMFFIAGAKKLLEVSPLRKISKYLSTLPIQIAILLFAWIKLRSSLPPKFGLEMVNFFHGGLFFFFLLGVVFFKKITQVRSMIIRAMPYVVFLALVPFWSRTLPNNLIASAPNLLSHGWLANKYALIVAISGTLAMTDFSRLIKERNIQLISTFMCTIGGASLGIYATHFYFITFKPPMILAVTISYLLYLMISNTPIARTVLLGK